MTNAKTLAEKIEFLLHNEDFINEIGIGEMKGDERKDYITRNVPESVIDFAFHAECEFIEDNEKLINITDKPGHTPWIN